MKEAVFCLGLEHARVQPCRCQVIANSLLKTRQLSDFVHKLFPNCVHTARFKLLEDVLKEAACKQLVTRLMEPSDFLQGCFN